MYIFCHSVTLRRAYGKRKREEGLDEKKDNIAYVATTCGFHFVNFINEARGINPNVTFSFEHPWGIAQTTPWYQSLKTLLKRETWVSGACHSI